MPLQTIIQSAISCHIEASAIRHLARLCHSIAFAYLRKKTVTGTFHSSRLGLSLDDLAYDCIADLFKRDDQGVFVTLKQYFEGIDYQTLTEEQLLGACRRLVFSKVTQELYRVYKEHDPDLHKIIRNIKDTVPRIPVVRLEERGGENTLVFGSSSIHLPVISPEILESYLTDAVWTQMTIREILLAAAEVFAKQEVYRRSYPLTGFALIVRAAFANLEVSASESAVENTCLTENELQQFISHSVSRVSEKMKKSYVGKGKLKEPMYSTYFRTIGEILCAEYVQNDGDVNSYYSQLLAQMPGLSDDEYRTKHRTILEYLAKLTRRDFVERVRKELSK